MKNLFQRLSGIFCSLFIVNAFATTHYVDLNSVNPTPPFTNWVSAATNIQDAVDAADPGDSILVTNGIYQTGAGISYEQGTNYPSTNRVAVTKPLTLQSINGPLATIIKGSYSGTFPSFSNPFRCVYLTNGAVLNGFTLTNGAAGSGGGAWCESNNVVITNCILAGNYCGPFYGGGAYRGTLNRCTLTGNSSYNIGGGAFACTLNNCVLTGNYTLAFGGGAYGCTLNNCFLQGNSADANYALLVFGHGGGASQCTLTNCTLIGNSAPHGAGASGCTLINCVLTANHAYDPFQNHPGTGGYGGGALDCTLKNSIIYFNSADISGANYYNGSLDYCCTTPIPSSGSGNITSAPLFVNQAGGNLRLQSNSPCINSGNNLYVTGSTDLDGNPRIAGGTVDIGAYEFQSPTSILSYAWAQQFGLPTDGSADYADTDGDHLNNWQEWIAGTIPTNAASVLIMNAPSNAVSGVAVTWQSVTNRTYFLQRATNLFAQPAFTSIQSNIVGRAGTTTYTNTTATSGGPYFYRVGVQ
jgi:hypothetical protein